LRVVLKVRRKGVIVLPKALREAAGIEEESEVVASRKPFPDSRRKEGIWRERNGFNRKMDERTSGPRAERLEEGEGSSRRLPRWAWWWLSFCIQPTTTSIRSCPT